MHMYKSKGNLIKNCDMYDKNDWILSMLITLTHEKEKINDRKSGQAHEQAVHTSKKGNDEQMNTHNISLQI